MLRWQCCRLESLNPFAGNVDLAILQCLFKCICGDYIHSPPSHTSPSILFVFPPLFFIGQSLYVSSLFLLHYFRFIFILPSSLHFLLFPRFEFKIMTIIIPMKVKNRGKKDCIKMLFLTFFLLFYFFLL